jgi:hypothetical protein
MFTLHQTNINKTNPSQSKSEHKSLHPNLNPICSKKTIVSKHREWRERSAVCAMFAQQIGPKTRESLRPGAKCAIFAARNAIRKLNAEG